jgi:uncharacterized membrane-anchored protein YitT (DUF2179 family)
MDNLTPARSRAKDFFWDVMYDCAGSILFATGFYSFANNAGFAPGGVTGIAMLIRHFAPLLPLGTLTLSLNVPILLCCLPLLGRRYLFKSLRTMLISTFFMDVVFTRLPVYTGSPLLAAIFTGICSGAGLGLIYMRGSTTGGSDFIIAAVKKKHPHLSFGQITLVLDGCVILAGWPVFGSIDAVLYGLIAVFAATIVMDKIIYGAGSGKLAIVVTDHGKEAAQAISDAVERGATIAPAVGSYTGQNKQLLYCACSNNEVFRVRQAVYSVDPGAIIMICEANEVFGEGFKAPLEN